MTELDPQTKSRIEAEERYRAELRAQADTGGQTAAVPERGRTNWGVWVAWAVVAALAWYFYTLYAGAQGPNVGVPVGVAITSQDTPDNLSKAIYLTATDAAGAEIAAPGAADLIVNLKPYDGEARQLLTRHYTLSQTDFGKGTRGMGAFKRDAVFVHLGDILDSELKTTDSGSLEILLNFASETGGTLQARDSIYVR